MMKYESDSKDKAPGELREQAGADRLDLPIPTEPLKSWRGLVDPDAMIAFSEQQLERVWSDPEFVCRRQARMVNVPFEMK
jgi:hypothetical protein